MGKKNSGQPVSLVLPLVFLVSTLCSLVWPPAVMTGCNGGDGYPHTSMGQDINSNTGLVSNIDQDGLLGQGNANGPGQSSEDPCDHLVRAWCDYLDRCWPNIIGNCNGVKICEDLFKGLAKGCEDPSSLKKTYCKDYEEQDSADVLQATGCIEKIGCTEDVYKECDMPKEPPDNAG
ncbi:MAG: hypothetical protein GXP49_04215 [Deltaproteobacteria bacterium]|nr:hypothetical protein [Deltaproteobacteria bacterium]